MEERARTDSGVMFVGENEGQLIGLVVGHRAIARRTRHSIYIVVGVLQAWVGRGVGRSLLEALEGWAVARGLHRLELNVAVENPRAIALYEKFGFEREGFKRHSRKVDSGYSDERPAACDSPRACCDSCRRTRSAAGLSSCRTAPS